MLRLASEADVNRRLPLIEMIKHYHIQGLVLSGSTLYRGICPFCGKPEFQAMPVHARWLCFACDRTGRTFDLARQLEDITHKAALCRINTWIRGESVIGSIICL